MYVYKHYVENPYTFKFVKPIIAYVHTQVNRKSIYNTESKVSMIYAGVIGSGL